MEKNLGIKPNLNYAPGMASRPLRRGTLCLFLHDPNMMPSIFFHLDMD